MVTADLRESGCVRGGRAAILVQYESIFIEIALLAHQLLYENSSANPERAPVNRRFSFPWLLHIAEAR